MQLKWFVFAKWSLRLSLNKPFMTWFEGNLPNDRQRERERESELDAKSYGNCRKQGTTGWISLLPGLFWMCTTVFAWFTASLMDCCVWSQVIAFGGGLSLYSFLCKSLTKNSCNTKVVFNHFDRGSYDIIYKYYIRCSMRSNNTTATQKNVEV